MIDIIGMIAAAAHWCASCASDANTLPGGLGIAGGAASAAGGLGALAPLSDLYPPGTTTNSNGDLTWQNPDGTTSTKGPDGTVATTGPTGTTTQYPSGNTATDGADGSHAFTDPSGHDVINPPSPDLPLEPDEAGNALASGLITGPVFGGVEALADGATALGDVAAGALGKIPEEVVNAADEALGKDDAHGIDDLLGWKPAPPDTPTLPDPIMGQTGYAFGDDGTITTIHPDGSSTTPNSDGSETTTQPGGTSSTTPATMTPRSGVFTSSDTGAGSSGDGS